MPIKVPQHIIDNDVILYGLCYIETDALGNERRLDPLQIRMTTGSSSNQLSRRGIVYKQEETPNIKGRLELRGQFDQLKEDEYHKLLGSDHHSNALAAAIWETIRQHGYMIVKPGTPSTIDDGLIAFKRYEPINKLELNKAMTDEQIEDFKKKFNEAMGQGIFQVPTSPVCTCRDDDKYSRPLCPVCDKEKFDGMKHDIEVTKEMFKDKPEDIISAEEFFKSIKGDI